MFFEFKNNLKLTLHRRQSFLGMHAFNEVAGEK